MNATLTNADQRGLPHFGGRLLWLYRIAWSALAIGAILASIFSLFQSAAPAPVLVLRLAKSAVLIFVATILLYRRQRDPVAALLALAFLMWIITSNFDFATDLEFPQLLDRCRFLLFALALLLFPDGKWQPRWTRIVAVASCIVFLVGIGETLAVLPTHVFLPLAIICVIAGIASLVARFRASTNFAFRQQIKWVALGLIAGVGLILSARAGAALSVAIPATSIAWDGLFQLGVMVVALGFLVSLLRYRLFDAETVITRSAAYAGLTIALVATFGGTEALIENVGQNYLGMNIGSVSGAMAAAVAAVMLNPLHGRITDWAEDRFQPDLVRLKRQVPELLARMGATSSSRRLCAAVLTQVTAAIHATHSAILLEGRLIAAHGIPFQEARRWTRQLPEDSSPLLIDGSDPLFPMRLSVGSGASSATWLLLGPRPDGTLYGKEDLDAVRSISPAFRQALISTRAREAIDAAVNRREKRLRNEIGDLGARLLAVESWLEARTDSGDQGMPNPAGASS